MAEIDDLLTALRANTGASAVSYHTATAVHDVYEGFLFSLVVLTAAQCGGSVSYENASGNSVGSLVFRTGPGRLYARNATYTHAVVRLGSSPLLEVHVGVRVRGSSGVLHECDVLVLERSEADWSRSQGADPRSTKCLLAVECKYYATPLPLGMARGFVGLRADLSGPDTVFVANVGSASVDRYLNSRSSGYEFDVLPDTRQAEYFQTLVRTAFRRHTSRHDPGYAI